jgi:transcriptional regulator with XRE-family HTH domain
MLVAYNLAFFRKAARLTQEELGEALGGWTKVAVSAAERSWDGKRIRQFDADLIADIATQLGVPIAAMFLPPADDGIRYRYRIFSEHEPGEQLTMRDIFPFVMSDPPPADTPVLRAYEERFVSAVGRYLDSEAAEELATRLKELANEQQFAQALRDARRNRAHLQGISDVIEDALAGNDLLQDVLTRALNTTSEGRELLVEARSAWAALPEAHRAWQSELVKIGQELFGERGPATRAQIDQIVEEARKRGTEGGGAAAVLLRPDGTYELVRPDEPARDDGS